VRNPIRLPQACTLLLFAFLAASTAKAYSRHSEAAGLVEGVREAVLEVGDRSS
jgi:hypothetical protein